MAAEILISVRPVESRVAYLDNGNLTDLKIERKTSPTMVGSIHVGQVIRVLPGMQAAFVNIGLDRAAFLYVGDVRTDSSGTGPFLHQEEADPDETDEPGLGMNEIPGEEALELRPKIQELLTEGQRILVQVSKDPIGTKGARLTTHVSLPGRNVVFMPTVAHVGVSRRIVDEDERTRLKNVVENLNASGGVIVRTAGEGSSEEDIRSDIEYLERLWQEVKEAYDKRSQPGMIHSELSVELRALRDMLNPSVVKILVDEKKTCDRIRDFVSRFMPRYKDLVELYTAPEPLFDRHEIDFELSRSLGRKVWLKSGGYIVFDEAEALTVIDVNTGKYVGKRDLEDTILKTNLEAVKEIAHQLRIRNCGGIIVIDFIDMEKEAHREKVLNSLREDVKLDPAKISIVSMTSLGLVEMTRKRIRPSLAKILCEPCPYCEGKGYIRQKATIAHEIFRAIERERLTGYNGRTTFVRCHSEIMNFVYSEENEMIEFLETMIGHAIAFKVEPEFHLEQFEVYSR